MSICWQDFGLSIHVWITINNFLMKTINFFIKKPLTFENFSHWVQVSYNMIWHFRFHYFTILGLVWGRTCSLLLIDWQNYFKNIFIYITQHLFSKYIFCLHLLHLLIGLNYHGARQCGRRRGMGGDNIYWVCFRHNGRLVSLLTF